MSQRARGVGNIFMRRFKLIFADRRRKSGLRNSPAESYHTLTCQSKCQPTILMLALAALGCFVSTAQAQVNLPAEQAEPATASVMSIIFSGGWPGVLIIAVLIGLSLTAVYLICEHALTIRRRELMPDGLADGVSTALAAGKLGQAEQRCREDPSFLSFVILHGLSEAEDGWPAVEKALEDATAEQAARLMRRIEFLSVIGNLAPMVGLLGTVTGMIIAFQRVAGSQGAAGAGDLAEGIYQALVTTVGGLVIAIPSLGAFAFYRNRVDQLVAEAAYLAHGVCKPLKRLRRVKAMPPALSDSQSTSSPVGSPGVPPKN